MPSVFRFAENLFLCVVSGQPDQARLEKGLRSLTASWAYQPAVGPRDCRFRVKVKKMAEARGW